MRPLAYNFPTPLLRGTTYPLGFVAKVQDLFTQQVSYLDLSEATLDPYIFDGVTTTPKQFEITKPANATTYRFVNPCDVDIRIRKVGSMSETVTLTTGIRYLARTVEVVGTSNPTFVSIMAVKQPSEPCAPELQYGNGS